MAYIFLKLTHYANVSFHFPMKYLLCVIQGLTLCFTISATAPFPEAYFFHLTRTDLLKWACHRTLEIEREVI